MNQTLNETKAAINPSKINVSGKVVVEDLNESKNIKFATNSNKKNTKSQKVLLIDPELKHKEDQFYSNLSNQNLLKEQKLASMIA